MTQNTRTPAELKAALDAIVDELKALDANALPDADLVPLAKSVQSVGAYVSAIDAQIQLRAITNNVLLPGVVVRDAIVHRKWHDQEAAEQLAQEQFGDKAFTRSLLSPAGIEKLGNAGKTFVSVASYKPEAGKKAVY
jgi:phosphoenolpyruvate carboxylase